MKKRTMDILSLGVVISLGLSTSYFLVESNRNKIEQKVHSNRIELVKLSEVIMAMPPNSKEEVEHSNNLDDLEEEWKYLLERKIAEAKKAEEDNKEKDLNTKNEKEEKSVHKENNKVDNKDIASAPTRGGSIEDNRTKPEVSLNGYLNKYVLDVIKTYKIGSYPYLLNNDYQNYNGVTENIYYQGELLLKANPNGNRASHCTGITFEVFFKAMEQRNKELGIDTHNFNGMTKDELFDFALTWYVANGPKSQSNLALAMQKYGIGYRITNLEEVKAGDFIDFSRENNTGHTAVFLNWIREGDKIIGFKYWSSQGSTNGIDYNEEYFNVKKSNGSKYGNVMIDNLYIGRVSPVKDYKSFK